MDLRQADTKRGNASSQDNGAAVDVSQFLDETRVGRFHIRTVVAAGVGFFTDAYDLFVIGTALTLLKGVWHLNTAQISLLSSVALLAAFFGAFIFGRIADVIGRRRVFVLVALIMIVGSVASALAPTLWVLVAARFVLGFGIGGDYPVSAVLTSEFANRADRGRLVGLVFSMQALGLIVGPLVGLVLVTSGINHDLAWRMMLGFGSIPAAAVVYLRLRMPESPRFAAQVKGVDTTTTLALVGGGSSETGVRATLVGSPAGYSVAGLQAVGHSATDAASTETGVADAASTETGVAETGVAETGVAETGVAETGDGIDDSPVRTRRPLPSPVGLKAFVTDRHWLVMLLGTAGTWFLFDYAYYGNSISTPLIINDVAPHASLATGLAWTALLFVVAAVPGYIMAFMTMDRIGHRRLQVIGFSVMAVSFALLGLVPSLTTVIGPFLAIYGVSYFFSEFGPNTTTFVMPAEVFPVSVRTTAHGASAGIAKLGAFLGVFLFPVFKQDYGLKGSMLIAATASIGGMLLTFVLPEPAGRSLEDLQDGRPGRRSDSERDDQGPDGHQPWREALVSASAMSKTGAA